MVKYDKSKLIGALLFCMVAIVSIYIIPYHIGSMVINVSASYDYGFNNKVGILVLIFFACIAFLFAVFLPMETAKGLHVLDLHKKHRDAETIKYIRWYIIIQFFISIGVVLLCIGTYGIGESAYFIKRSLKLEYGLDVYSEFDYSYGLLFIYLPYYINKLLGIGIPNAYYFLFLFVNILGVAFQGYIVYHLNLETIWKKKILFLLFISSLPFTLITGVSSNPFRLLIAPFFMVMYLKQTVVWKKITFIFFSVLLSFNVSPEVGIVLAICYVVRNVYSVCCESNRINSLAGIACALLPFAFASRESLITLFAFATGGYNWPFVISIALTLFFLVVLYIAFYVGLQAKKYSNYIDDLSFELLLLCFIPAALGRCDPGHIVGNCIFLFVMVFIFLQCDKMRRAFYALNFIMIVLLCPYYIKQDVPDLLLGTGNSVVKTVASVPAIKKGIYNIGASLGVNEEKIKRRIYSEDPFEHKKMATQLMEVQKVATPFGCSVAMEAYLMDSGKYFPLVCEEADYGSKKQIENRLDDMRKTMPPYLILPHKWENMNMVKDYEPILKLLFMAPFNRSRINNSNELYDETLGFISEKYLFVNEVSHGYDLYRLK